MKYYKLSLNGKEWLELKNGEELTFKSDDYKWRNINLFNEDLTWKGIGYYNRLTDES